MTMSEIMEAEADWAHPSMIPKGGIGLSVKIMLKRKH
jgi:hypothetical protein